VRAQFYREAAWGGYT